MNSNDEHDLSSRRLDGNRRTIWQTLTEKHIETDGDRSTAEHDRGRIKRK